VKLLSIDLGRTSTKACVSRDPEGVVLIPAYVYHPTAIEEVRRGAFETRANADPLLDIWVEYQGEGYAVGQYGADLQRKLESRTSLGLGESKVRNALIKLFAAVGHFGLSGSLAVVLGLPYILSQEQFDKEKTQITGLILGRHRMAFRSEIITIDIEDVWVVPEGYGSLFWAESLSTKGSKFGDLSVAIVDIGHQTTDFLMIDRFRFARGISSSEDFAMSQFYAQLAGQIEDADPDSPSLIEAVHRPEGERFYRPPGASRPTNLDDIMPPLRKSFARELSNRLIHWLPERATDVIITGGGGEFVWDDLSPLLKEAGLKGHLANPCRKANVLGQYIYGETRLAAGR
jgi:plasmid segregation protein ParM